MADLIDVWSDRMFWGDKGMKDGTNFAGTSNEKLPMPNYHLKYGGSGGMSMSAVNYVAAANMENLPPYYDNGYNGGWNNGYHSGYYSPA